MSGFLPVIVRSEPLPFRVDHKQRKVLDVAHLVLGVVNRAKRPSKSKIDCETVSFPGETPEQQPRRQASVRSVIFCGSNSFRGFGADQRVFGLIECAASVTLGDILAPELLGIDAVKRFLFVGSLSFDFNRSDIDKFPKARFERLLC